MDFDELFNALNDPAAYPHRPERVETVQTHASALFFAGEHVYKVKKPVDLGFLNFSTLEKRRFFCDEEIRLNRRLAPDVYLGVVSITRDSSEGVRIDGSGETIDYAVHMRRLPAERMFDRLLERGRVGQTDLEKIAATLAEFHAKASAGAGVDEHGQPKAVRRKIVGNLEQCEPYAGEIPDQPAPTSPALSRRMLDRLREWSERFIERNRGLLERRIEGGRIREGHGDLHAGNICLADDGVVIYDCIEFEPAFRCADVAAELAFLGMDLDRRGRRNLSRELIERYSQRTNDPDMFDLQPLYRSHFASVRGKVAAIRAGSEGQDDEAGRRARSEAAKYFQLAVGYTLPPSLVLMCGLPGSGKSSAAEALAPAIGAEVLRSDEIRKELWGMAPTEHWTGPIDEGPYRPEFSRRTYDALLERTRERLEGGWSVVADATFSKRDSRRAFAETARQRGAPFLVVHTVCPETEIERRMARRAADQKEVSDADLQVYRKAKSGFEPPSEFDGTRCVEFDSTGAFESAAARGLDALIQQASRSEPEAPATDWRRAQSLP